MLKFLWLKLRFAIGLMAVVSACVTLTACGGGSNEGGNEGPEGAETAGGTESGNEGNEGSEGNGSGSTVPFVSNGQSRGALVSVPLAANDTYAGLLQDTEVAVYFDATNRKFVGRVRNEAPAAVCDVKVSAVLDGTTVVNQTLSGRPFVLAGLVQGGSMNFEFPVAAGTFSNWTIGVETSGCTSAPTATGTGEGTGEGGSEGGSESGSESGSEGGGESGSEASPPILITDSFNGTFQGQNFQFAFDTASDTFRGTVENPTQQYICASRTEIHAAVGTQVIELGPTIPVNLAPGETLNIVMEVSGQALDTYSLHPEASPCP